MDEERIESMQPQPPEAPAVPEKKQPQLWALLLIVILIGASMCGGGFLYRALSEKAKTPETLPSVDYTQTATDDFETAAEPAADAVDMTVFDGDGNPVRLSDRRGRIVIVNFWASWCRPCGKELPDFDAAYQTYGDRVDFMMVNLTQMEDDAQDGAALIDRLGLTFPVYFDTDGNAADRFDIQGIPVTLFLWPDGTVYQKRVGMLDYETLDLYIQTMIEAAG